jgi:hypothetical protein
MEEFNIYCDESCHLENDHQKAMAIGAIMCPKSDVKRHFKNIRNLKLSNGLSATSEAKWTKVSPSKINFYFALVDYFFKEKGLFFRAIIIPDKSILDHKKRYQTHNGWYYKMFFLLLKPLIDLFEKYNIYMDVKDTTGGQHQRALKEILSRNMYDFGMETINKIQGVDSCEVELLQLVDVFVGALSYYARNITTSKSKLSIIKTIESYCSLPLQYNRPISDRKFNLFYWNPSSKV